MEQKKRSKQDMHDCWSTRARARAHTHTHTYSVTENVLPFHKSNLNL